MNPEIKDVITWAENCPVIVLFWIMNGNSLRQKVVSTPIRLEALHRNLYVGKLIFFGPKIIVSKIKSLNIKHTKAHNTTEISDLIICHLSSSRCSKKDILFGFFIKKDFRVQFKLKKKINN